MVKKAILEHAEGKGLPFLGLQARKGIFFFIAQATGGQKLTSGGQR